MKKKIKIIVSGGGTGGHIYPAISIANALKENYSNCEILFVGAEGKMEMEKVPAAGYKIIGLPIRGLQRNFSMENLKFLPRLMKSLSMAKRIVKDFQPDVVVGVGGYASGPLLYIASRLGVPAIIQEQNSYAGITNKLLSKKAHKICVAYEGMDRFFPPKKILLTGNPVRNDLVDIFSKKEEAIYYFGLDPNKKTILIVGGSLGARTINNSVINSFSKIGESGVQFIWQTGKYYFDSIKKELENWDMPDMRVHAFLSHMDLAYAASDLVISRAGAGTISELCLVGKPCILVPSPNVSEDHQTKNAMALVDKRAAVMVKDADAENDLINQALYLVNDFKKLTELASSSKALAKPNAATDIAEQILAMI
ncbi:undecaprenyldiphospho-muramoylpentapeptide beta-N-acetylglucosaminyltransferase [Ancylomarina longa]|uniref:UDP-N-acetylglucosamine--N-acetylmuramyl-(pentapeptide) pyrophosphoryl-undecaprenol N-acetylglucosamine transferase n=1 Tax=Ancylomarina longa TaxID=2487017 RepID=A0A434AUN8_9BACT|nr:undecaprenyldiphospho-muramoylpentapeptide beta-N-acetylglucosaminyltransferase [Ancylomarina longa]RUT78145.1 undecaprenyldiphospho-muramoylpentapeptide beta-N-acetylglucosaminyltransferase [Ancylomarina longa]